MRSNVVSWIKLFSELHFTDIVPIPIVNQLGEAKWFYSGAMSGYRPAARLPLIYALIVFQSIWFAILLTALIIRPLSWTGASLGIDVVSLLALINIVIGLIATGLVTRTLWDTRMLLYISLVLFNSGAFLAHIFAPKVELVSVFLTDVNLAAAGYFVNVCLAGWVLGTLICTALVQPRDFFTTVNQRSKLRLVGLVFVAIGTIPTLLQINTAIQVVASGGYMALYQQEVEIGVSNWQGVAGGFFIPGLLFLLGSGTLHKRGLVIIMSAVIAYVALKLSLGSRSPAVMPLIAAWFIWHYRVRTISPRIALGVGGSVLLVLLPAVAVLRQQSGLVSLSPSAIIDAISKTENPLLALLFETGGSIVTTAYSLNYIPDVRSFGYGSSYLTSLWTILPSTGGLNPAIQGDNVYADWLTRTVDASLASIGGGYGFSPIAEAYANFGEIGGAIGFLLISILIQSVLTSFSNYRNIMHVVLSGVVISILLVWARGETVTFVRPVVWFAVFPAFYLLVNIGKSVKLADGRKYELYRKDMEL